MSLLHVPETKIEQEVPQHLHTLKIMNQCFMLKSDLANPVLDFDLSVRLEHQQYLCSSNPLRSLPQIYSASLAPSLVSSSFDMHR